MKASYPLTAKSGIRTEPARIFWIEKHGRAFYVDGKKMKPNEAARIIHAQPHRSIFFFPDLREQVGALIPHLLKYGMLSGAGDQLRSLHFIQDGTIIFLSDASLYFHDPSLPKIQALNQALFEELHVRLAPTPGNTALRAMRRFIQVPALWQPGDLIREVGRAALYGGALHWRNGEYPHAYKYDIHAAYAWAMKQVNLPTKIKAWPGAPRASSDGFIMVVRADFASDRTFSPLTLYGEDDEAYHPTLALDVTLALNHLDMQTLVNSGTLNIKKIICSLSWQAGPPALAETMERLGDAQNKYPELRSALKIITNSCYGKLAESDDLSTLTLTLFNQASIGRDIVDVIEADHKLYALIREKIYKPAPQHNPIYASLITAQIRTRLYAQMDDQTVYADTDGFITTRPIEGFEGSDVAGEWYLESAGRAIVLGPRIYGIASKIKVAGQHEAIGMRDLLHAMNQEVKVFETIKPNPLLLEKIRSSGRTLKAIKYPHVEALNGMLYVTRSPTIRIKSKLPSHL